MMMTTTILPTVKTMVMMMLVVFFLSSRAFFAAPVDPLGCCQVAPSLLYCVTHVIIIIRYQKGVPESKFNKKISPKTPKK